MNNKRQTLFALVTRNCRQYFREKSAVFFSLLAMIIVVTLMLFFLGNNLQDSILQVLEKIPNRDTAKDFANVKQFVFFWSCGGILSVNSVTVVIAVYSGLLKDEANGKVKTLYTAPIQKSIVAMGYVLSAWITSVIMGIITFFCAEMIGVILGYSLFSFTLYCKVVALILLSSFVCATILYCLALLIKSEAAWSGLSTIVGTLVGFLGGIYLPIGSLTGAIATVMKCTPVIYSAALFRDVLCADSLAALFTGTSEKVKEEMALYFGNGVEVFGKPVSASSSVLGLLFVGIVFWGISVLLLRKRKLQDR